MVSMSNCHNYGLYAPWYHSIRGNSAADCVISFLNMIRNDPQGDRVILMFNLLFILRIFSSLSFCYDKRITWKNAWLQTFFLLKVKWRHPGNFLEVESTVNLHLNISTALIMEPIFCARDTFLLIYSISFLSQEQRDRKWSEMFPIY